VAVLVGLGYRKRIRPPNAGSLFRPAGLKSVSRLKARLVRLVHDRAVADRLIESERRRHPDLSDVDLLRRVIRRLRRDRRR
jgi:hypothetical protein